MYCARGDWFVFWVFMMHVLVVRCSYEYSNAWTRVVGYPTHSICMISHANIPY